MSLDSVEHAANKISLRWSTRLVILLKHYAKTLELNVSRIERRLNNVHEVKRRPADRPAGFRRSAYKNELNEKRMPGGQTGTLQAICVQDRAERRKGISIERVGTPQASHGQDRAECENKHDGTGQHMQRIQRSHGGAR